MAKFWHVGRRRLQGQCFQQPAGQRTRADHRDHTHLEAEQRQRRPQRNGQRAHIHPGPPWPGTVDEHGVVNEEQRQAGNHANHCGGDGGQWRGEAELAVGGLDQRPAGQNEQERRQKGEPGHHAGGQCGAQKKHLWPEHLLRPAAHKADKRHHHDQRARRGFAQGQSVDHLQPGEPLVVLNGTLVHIGQHRVGAAKGQQRGFGEEPAHLRQCAVPALPGHQQAHGQQPERRAHSHQQRQPCGPETGVWRGGGVVVDHRRAVVGLRRAMATASGKLRRRPARAQPAGECGGQHHPRERHRSHVLCVDT
eukprot:Opistho-2@91371